LSNKSIEKYATINDTIKPIALNLKFSVVGVLISSIIGIADEIIITGIERIIENLAASILFKFRNLDPVYTIPARLVPGITDKT
jgi:hypothetical protein